MFAKNAPFQPIERAPRRTPIWRRGHCAMGRHGIEPPRRPPHHLSPTGLQPAVRTPTLAAKLRGLESNQRPPGSEPGVTYQQQLPRKVLHCHPIDPISGNRSIVALASP